MIRRRKYPTLLRGHEEEEKNDINRIIFSRNLYRDI